MIYSLYAIDISSFFSCHSDLRSVQEFAGRWGWWSFGQRSAEPLQKRCLGATGISIEAQRPKRT